MKVSGEEAANFNAVRGDDMTNANKGPLISADTDTGTVVYRDITGEEKTVECLPHGIRLLRKPAR